MIRCQFNDLYIFLIMTYDMFIIAPQMEKNQTDKPTTDKDETQQVVLLN